MSAINPSYYQYSGIQCIDVIENLSVCQANAIKYLWRLGQKDNDEQEIKKCQWYLNRILDKELPIVIDDNALNLMYQYTQTLDNYYRKQALLAVVKGDVKQALKFTDVLLSAVATKPL